MARLRCATKARDATLLDAWLRHHGHLFGFESLTVLDGGSSDAATVKLLSRAARAGVEIRREQGELSGEEFGNPIDGVQSIVLECDEFLAVYTADGVSCRRDRIRAALETWRGELQPGFSPRLVSVDGAINEFAVLSIPTGVSPGGTPVTSLRFGESPIEGGAIRVLFQGLGNLLDAFGIHDRRFGSPVATPRRAAEDTVWVRSVEGAPAARFKASAYCRANEDVGSSDWLPFLHYAALGAREGRRIS